MIVLPAAEGWHLHSWLGVRTSELVSTQNDIRAFEYALRHP